MVPTCLLWISHSSVYHYPSNLAQSQMDNAMRAGLHHMTVVSARAYTYVYIYIYIYTLACNPNIGLLNSSPSFPEISRALD